ncbi:MAG: AEC family transporter [Dehalococcoidia bacterium]
MLAVFLEVVLPVALVAVAGGIVGRWRSITVAPLSALAFYLFGPMLVFDAMASTEVPADTSAKIIGVMVVTFVAMYAFSLVWSTVVSHEPSMRAGFALAATSPNVGNMGLPVALLAFGEQGLQIAVMNFVAGALLVNSAGIAIASLAGGSHGRAWVAPFRYPALYAALAGVAVNVLNIDLPPTIASPTSSLAAAAVPVMLVVLGLQLQTAGGRDHMLDTAVVNVARLAIAPVVAWYAATALGLTGDVRGTLVVLAAMPTAVIVTILATEFRAQPAFVTRVVVTSTLAAMLSLTLVITIVQGLG